MQLDSIKHSSYQSQLCRFVDDLFVLSSTYLIRFLLPPPALRRVAFLAFAASRILFGLLSFKELFDLCLIGLFLVMESTASSSLSLLSSCSLPQSRLQIDLDFEFCTFVTLQDAGFAASLGKSSLGSPGTLLEVLRPLEQLGFASSVSGLSTAIFNGSRVFFVVGEDDS
jgi:hypothetical protein